MPQFPYIPLKGYKNHSPTRQAGIVTHVPLCPEGKGQGHRVATPHPTASRTYAHVGFTMNTFLETMNNEKKWIRRWHAFGLCFAVSNGRIKKRDERRYKGGWVDYMDIREKLFEAQGRRCPHCGKEATTFKELEAHHVLPWGRFPELRNKQKNLILLCHRCHKEVHCNPWLNIAMMERKAEELGIDLAERYRRTVN